MFNRFSRIAALLASSAILAGCVGAPPPETYREPEIVTVTETQSALRDLPAPTNRVPLAVYGFADKTGQFKPQENVQTLSRAVTQGGADLLIKALRDAGDGAWFTVLEREGLDNLLKERQIIRDMRQRYLGERRVNPQALPPLLFAGVILEGGIVGFDSNTLTGGVGARFLGIGGDVEYRQNTIAVNLRAVSVKTGEVLANVSVDKTLASVGIAAGAFKFIDFDELLEAEAGFTNNEPGTMALRRAIEKAVYSLVIEGAQTGLWAFADQAAAARLIARNRAETHGRRADVLVEAATGGAPSVDEARPARLSRTAPQSEATDLRPFQPDGPPASAIEPPKTAAAPSGSDLRPFQPEEPPAPVTRAQPRSTGAQPARRSPKEPQAEPEISPEITPARAAPRAPVDPQIAFADTAVSRPAEPQRARSGAAAAALQPQPPSAPPVNGAGRAPDQPGAPRRTLTDRAPARPAAPQLAPSGPAYSQPEEPDVALADLALSPPGEN